LARSLLAKDLAFLFIAMNKTFVCLILLFNTLLSYSQTKAEKLFGTWLVVHGNHIISNHWSINTGFQARYYKIASNYNLSLGYVGVNYKITESFIANITYGYLDIDRTFDRSVIPNTIEHRHFEQLSYTNKLLDISFSQRLRLEHRHLHSVVQNTLVNRVRYRIKSKVPITPHLYFNINNEFFFEFEGKGYTENRFISALGCKLSEYLAIELGYLHQYINDFHLHRLQIGILFKTDLRKKKN